MISKQEAPDLADRHCCPITLQPIRHPVVGSDSRRYELKALHEWVFLQKKDFSPITKAILTSVTYDIQLKEELDSLMPSERYAEYPKDEYLKFFNSTINSTYDPRKQSAYKSILTVNVCLVIYLCYALSETKNRPVQTANLFLFILLGGLTDYLLRMASADRYSFFSIIDKPVHGLLNYLSPDDDPSLIQSEPSIENSTLLDL